MSVRLKTNSLPATGEAKAYPHTPCPKLSEYVPFSPIFLSLSAANCRNVRLGSLAIILS